MLARKFMRIDINAKYNRTMQVGSFIQKSKRSTCSSLHAFSSYRKLSEILTSCVSYFFPLFVQTLFLNFSTLYGLRILTFLRGLKSLEIDWKILKKFKSLQKMGKILVSVSQLLKYQLVSVSYIPRDELVVSYRGVSYKKKKRVLDY